MDSFAMVLPTPSYSSMYEAICEKNESVLISNDHNSAGPCEPGSRCRPNECIFRSGKPQGDRDFGMRGI
jgi:hypothetical protein